MAIDNKRIWLMLSVLLVVTSGYAAQTLGWKVLEQPGAGTFPLIEGTFWVADPLSPAHPAASRAYDAFRDVYGPHWYRQHVLAGSILQVSRLHDPLLATVLPSHVAVGSVTRYAEHVLVPVRLYLSDQSIVSLDLFYREDQVGQWSITAIAID